MYLPASSFVPSTVGEDLSATEPKCNSPGKGTNESDRDRLDSNEGLHVHTLPRQSVIVMPVKLVLNKTTNRAGWSVPQSRQARELQAAIFNELNEEVSRSRREQMVEAKRKETVRRFRRQKHKRGKQDMAEHHFFRTDRCSTCEFLDLEISTMQSLRLIFVQIFLPYFSEFFLFTYIELSIQFLTATSFFDAAISA